MHIQNRQVSMKHLIFFLIILSSCTLKQTDKVNTQYVQPKPPPSNLDPNTKFNVYDNSKTINLDNDSLIKVYLINPLYFTHFYVPINGSNYDGHTDDGRIALKFSDDGRSHPMVFNVLGDLYQGVGDVHGIYTIEKKTYSNSRTIHLIDITGNMQMNYIRSGRKLDITLFDNGKLMTNVADLKVFLRWDSERTNDTSKVWLFNE